jgi:trehalose 6-phosphate phosphatase
MTISTPPTDLYREPLCLFLDVDGTLLELADTPDGVEVRPSLRSLMDSASRAVDGALALVSGRSLQQLDRIFSPRQWPAAGLHGLERRDASGRIHRPHGSHPDLLSLRPQLEALARRDPGLILEDKGGTFALHFRQAPQLERELTDEMAALVERLGQDYHLQPGSFVLELKPSGVSKAHAIDEFLAEPPFAGRRPLFAGDDLTDLDGFAAVERRGGVSVSVGQRVKGMIALPDPRTLHRFLKELTQPPEATS